MKTFKYIAMAAIAATMVSCDDFFDTESPSAMDASVFTSASQTSLVINGVYNCFGEDYSYRKRLSWIQAMNTDIEYNRKTDAGYKALTEYNSNPANTQVSRTNGKDAWGTLTSAMCRATSIIDGIHDNSDLKKSEFRYFLGEAYFLRAFVTLEMVKLWGDIPFMASNSDFTSLKRDRNEAFEQIREDLQNAKVYLPWSESDSCVGIAKNNICRPNRAAAAALLARADLMYAGMALRPDTWINGGGSSCSVQYNIKDAGKRLELYKEAMNACKEVIDHYGDSKLASDYSQVFKDLCQDKTSFTNTEWLWVMPMEDGARGQFLNFNAPGYKNGNKYVLNCGNSSVQSAVCVVPTLIFDFDPQDKRKWVTIMPSIWTGATNGKDAIGSTATTDALKDLFPEHDGTSNIAYQKKTSIKECYLGKYRYEWCSREISSGDDGIDIPVLRYADVLLMYAEAAMGGIDGVSPDGADLALAQQCLDKVRARAGLGSVALNMENIENERAFEFCGEMIRKFDLMRWGLFGTNLKKAMTRMAELNAHTGEFSDTQSEICFKYVKNDNLKGASATHAYEISDLYGLAHGEVGEPAGFDKNAGWIKKDFFADDGVDYIPQIKLYQDESILEYRQYWPIFQEQLSSCDGTLWNDYGY